ncbi:hypothetical protein [Idiomarina piscisalsi]|uniref:hypothetical protein n=1 Tax=Idiomarina piscisalsi TaxID=1096243 RepID=UPI00137FC27F|nr:hypothetical protein [Idiomarina piscisalsi]MTJ02036.1 hypothetical protein [Idiomarina piscisalsi]
MDKSLSRYVFGQSATECLVALSLLVVILGSISGLLVPASEDSEKLLKLSRQVVWEKVRDREKTQVSGNYQLNNYLGSVIGLIDDLVPVELEGTNLRMTKTNYIPRFGMVRLTDSWEPKHRDGLVKRPASLVINNVLSGEVMETIQDGLGRAFLAKELESDSLIFGHIDPDVVPESSIRER